ncbi:hypothetical protein NVP1139A_55 [Vibrio phage 1.139.A._10N.261.48.C6]|nr:hypothetical protein NVP1034O_54 [Vibrio phage 1.034.O._10N.261.46.B7]AUR83485.1 hypothetical protein NVP1034X_55 [Vibrio phage 1.034.X._10N.261.46.B7]AUR90223.1 hypothetical protein NVP1139A_55 [Vibrio phage 1.139.A._10N.261.48.C6]AUR90290.1 hypothetical protein NVP1139B_55 [Vibrio phage 1.139.B._10N.261.48.C6]AUR95611.1 hypothetical protein NVP1209O_54 [Vibrio phage 1.209.O._10N.222.52.B2]
MSKRISKKEKQSINTKNSVLNMALSLVRVHIDYRASVAPNGNELWYYDKKNGGQKQLSIHQCIELVDDLYGSESRWIL